jgi:hypothetical protein
LSWSIVELKRDFSNHVMSENLKLNKTNETKLKDSQNAEWFNALNPHKLIDLNNFTFLINKPCENLNQLPIVVITINSAPANFRNRKIIRETWGGFDSRSLIVFMLGAVPDDVQSQLELENKVYGDIVQGNFIDSYQNLTYKHAMVFKWFLESCPTVKFLLKTDDDVFINTPLMYEYLQGNGPNNSTIFNKTELMLCDPAEFLNPIRSESKWKVTVEEYSNNVYPPYCRGYVVFYSSDAVLKLYRGVQRLKYFWIEDVHVTGVVAQIMNVTIEPLGDLILDFEMEAQFFFEGEPIENHSYLVAAINFDIQEMKNLWNDLKSNQN